MLNALQINQKIISNRLSIEQSIKLWRFRKSTGHLCILILPEYRISVLPAHTYEIVITKAWFPLDRNAIVESYDSNMFWLTGKRLTGIYGNTFFFHKLQPTWVIVVP